VAVVVDPVAVGVDGPGAEADLGAGGAQADAVLEDGGVGEPWLDGGAVAQDPLGGGGVRSGAGVAFLRCSAEYDGGVVREDVGDLVGLLLLSRASAVLRPDTPAPITRTSGCSLLIFGTLSHRARQEGFPLARLDATAWSACVAAHGVYFGRERGWLDDGGASPGGHGEQVRVVGHDDQGADLDG
jgi:hypothetical protein